MDPNRPATIDPPALPLRVLVVEDSPDDAELMIMHLSEEGFTVDWRRVDNEADYLSALEGRPDLILSDWTLPCFSGTRALSLLRERNLDIPFIIVSGNIGEESAIESLHQGAYDYILKDRPGRIGKAVQKALAEREQLEANREAERRLRESEARYQAFTEATVDAVFIKDTQFRFVMVNKKTQELYAAPPERLIGATDFDFLPPETAAQCRNSDRKALEEYRVVISEETLGERVFETTKFPVTWGDSTGIGGYIHEITDRKKAAESLLLQSTALDAAPNAILITDRSGYVEWVNPAFTRLTGYTAEECIGRQLSALEGKREPDLAQIAGIVDSLSSKPVWKGKNQQRKKDGSLYIEEQSITPVRDDKGTLLHLVVIKEDVTERNHRERELVAMAVFNSSLRTAVSREAMLPATLDLLVSIFRTETAAIDSIDPTSCRWLTEQARGAWAALTGSCTPIPEGASVEATSTGQYHVAGMPKDSPALASDTGDGLLSIASYLTGQGLVIGRLRVGRKESWSESDVKLLEVISEIVATYMITAALREKTEEKLHQLTALQKIDHAISGSLDLEFILNVLLDQTLGLLSCDAASILIWNPATQYLEHIAARGFKGQEVLDVHLRLGEGESGRAALERRTRTILDLRKDEGILARSKLVREEGFITHHTTPLIVKGEIKGILQVFHRRLHDPKPGWYEFFETLAQQAAIAIDNAGMFESLQKANAELSRAYDATIEGWSRAMDLRDKETEGHSQRVTDLTVRLGRMLGMGEGEIVQLRRGALLHDMGKMGVPDHILFKPGPLTEEEWVIMKRHPVDAFNMLSSIDYLVPALDIPYCHHEKWDGTGYPRGLKGEDIPLPARIFAIVDVWDALTSDRPYRKAWTQERTLEHIRSQSGSHFDPTIVEAFFKILV